LCSAGGRRDDDQQQHEDLHLGRAGLRRHPAPSPCSRPPSRWRSWPCVLHHLSSSLSAGCTGRSSTSWPSPVCHLPKTGGGRAARPPRRSRPPPSPSSPSSPPPRGHSLTCGATAKKRDRRSPNDGDDQKIGWRPTPTALKTRNHREQE
jgi:hypothetical protein